MPELVGTGVGRARFLVLAIGIISLITILWAASTSAAMYGPFNYGWNGTSELRTDLEAADTETSVAAGPEYDSKLEPNTSAVLVLSPSSPLTQETVSRLRVFVVNGGTVIIAEDFGNHSNRLLAGIGATARFNGSLLRDPIHYSRTPVRPFARVDGNTQLTLNHGTAIHPNAATVLVSTSEFAYLDVNRSGDLDFEESMRSYAVVTREAVGDGTVIAISDPSIFINGMQSAAGNRKYSINLLTAHDHVVFDTSHGSTPPPLATGFRLFQQSRLVQMVVGLTGLLIVAVWTGPALVASRGRIVAVGPTIRRIVTRSEQGREDE